MIRIFGWGARPGAVLNENKGGPWGTGGGGGGPRTPWGQPARRPRGGSGNITSLDEFLKKSRDRFGGHFPQHDGRPYWLYGLGVALAFWLLFTSIHRIGPQENGVVTRFGSYVSTMQPGIGLTLPSPIDRVEKVDVQEIRTIDIGASGAGGENRLLTGDQNIINLAYSVRWKIKEPERYLFQISKPEDTIRDVAESAMRAIIAGVTLDEAIGSGRSEIEQRVQLLMQGLLNEYRAGVEVQGIAIKQSDPPSAVTEAFKDVSAAQQQAQSYLNDARAYALQITANAQGEAAAFDKVYEQYRLAPEVTRRRMYYETMERVLSKVDKTVVEGGSGVTPYLALPELQRRAPAAAAPGAAQ
jgi:membrane protease subunit HflK